MDAAAKWADVVRRPGSAKILHWMRLNVPPSDGNATDRGARAGIRLALQPIAMHPPAHLVDITSTAVIAMLEPWLVTGTYVGKDVSWRSVGYGRQRRDELRITNPRG